MKRTTRPISWIKAARKDFEVFPTPVQLEGLRSLGVAAEGSKADNCKPLKGFDSGVLEILLKHRGDAFRVVYAVQIGTDQHRHLGGARLSEEIDPRHQDPAT